jgi:MinD-like ATPase involved in chromosome partitioning or flagellar assembly
MNILSTENIIALITACAAVTDELVIDMSCVCDERTTQIFELADRVILVTDPSHTAQIKLSQFSTQNNVFSRIKSKAALVANKGATTYGQLVEPVIRLPHIQSANAPAVYKTLSGSLSELQVAEL